MRFTLYTPDGEENPPFPTSVETDGRRYNVDSDFRTVLRIFSIASDPDLSEGKKYAEICRLFYRDFLPSDPVAGVVKFLSLYNEDSEAGKPTQIRQFDFDFDAREIFIGFLKEYNLNLIEVEYLNWHMFRLMLDGLSSESLFRQKIRLRFADTSKLQGKALAELTRLKKSVRIPERLSRSQQLKADELLRKLK